MLTVFILLNIALSIWIIAFDGDEILEHSFAGLMIFGLQSLNAYNIRMVAWVDLATAVLLYLFQGSTNA